MRYLLLIALALVRILANSQVDQVSYTRFPDSLFDAGCYQMARIEYERLIYEDPSNAMIRSKALLGKAKSEKQLELYDIALSSLKRMPLKDIPQNITAAFMYEMALLDFLNKNPEEALTHLPNPAVSQDTFLKKNILFLGVMLKNELGLWDLAHQDAMEFVRISDKPHQYTDSIERIIGHVYARHERPSIRNVKRASVLSTILPGAGQIYAGYPLNGLLSLAYCSLSLAASMALYQNGLLLSAYALGPPLFIRFYLGGINSANRLAQKHNRKVTGEFNAKMIQLLSLEETGSLIVD